MPDNLFFDAVTDRMPKFNQEVVDGLAVAEMEHTEDYIERVWQCVQPDFPEGLKYEGMQRLTPKEEYYVRARRGQSSSSIEIARSNVYMVQFNLSWQGQMLPPCYTSLPIVEDGGIMYIRGSMCSICPVLADPAISVGTDFIFIPIFRDRITYYRHQHHFKVNGVQKGVYVVWANIHHEIKKGTKAGGSRTVTTLGHYLFAKYGVTGAFERYAGAHVKVGTSDTITREEYPASDWVICSSIHKRPLKLKDNAYIYPDVVIAVPREEYSETVENLMASFFYVADYYPRRVVADEVDETYLWTVLLGISIWGQGISEGQLAVKAEGHLQSLDGYIDNEARKDLGEEGLNVHDIYDLFVYLIDNFTKRIVEAYPNLSSMYDKKLMVLRYVLKDLVASINLFMYRLKANQKKQLTAKDISERLNAEINPDMILKINSQHGEVDTGVSSPGDNKYFKITSRICKQVNSSGPRARTISLTDPANFLHPSIAECGSYLTPSGAAPTGHERINPCVQLSPTRMILRRPETRELLDDVERRIRRN
jgi:hypothetical protein